MVRSICLVILGLAFSAQCAAQQALVGTYRLVSNDLRLDGEPIKPMGKSQHGYLVITPKIMISFFTADERKIGATIEAKAALLDTLTAWAGPYRVEGNKITSWTASA